MMDGLPGTDLNSYPVIYSIYDTISDLHAANRPWNISVLDYSRVAIDGLIKRSKGKNFLSNIYPYVYHMKIIHM